jgi:methylase of polypeptide subunit release factors
MLSTVPIYFTPGTVDHRRAILSHVGSALDFYSRTERMQTPSDNARSTVWSFHTNIGKPTATVAPAGTHLHIAWPIGLSASIAVRLGDVRIGLVVPQRLVQDASFLSGFLPYPETALSPRRVFRTLGDSDALIDFLFSTRLGDFDLTRKALTGSKQDIDLLADALAMETSHLIAALAQHLADSGLFVGVGDFASMVPLYVTTSNDRVADVLDVPRAQVMHLGDGEVPGSRRYIVMVSQKDEESMQRVIDALQHGEFMESQTVPGAFLVDGLEIQASPGVYHPGRGSSSLFFLSYLTSEWQNLTARQDGAALRLLDLGCGAGPIALAAKKEHTDWQVSATDIDEQAVADTAANAAANGLNVAVAQADLLDLPMLPQWRAPWDCITWNYPFWQARPEHSPPRPFDRIGLDENGALLRRFIAQLPAHLARTGACYLTYSSMADTPLLRSLCEQHEMTCACAHIEARDPGGYSRQVWKISHKTPA